MAYMTDEEADALDEELTRITPTLGPNGTGLLSRKGIQLNFVKFTGDALAAGCTASEAREELVQKPLYARAE
jgi:hypothetical protein